MKLQNTLFSFFILTFGLTNLKAQDSIRLFPKIEQQYSVERQLKNNFYYNPASMSGYSNFSFTDFSIGYENEKRNIYRPQEGSGQKGLSLKVTSYKKQNDHRSIWGNARYQNLNISSVKWNENLDFDRIAPYSIADSAGGDTKLERYQFSGGISQKINRWTFGLEASYLAQLGSRNRDPRQKSTTSDLNVNLGVNYRFYNDFEIGIFGNLNKYTQNTSIKFVSDLGQALMYQMTGFGFSNYFFNGGSPAAIYEEFGYKVGGQIFKNSKNPFYLTGYLSQSKNQKSVNPTNRYFDISDLDNENYQIETAKFFSIHQHRVGLVANYQAFIRTGSEYGYTNNTEIIEQIYKRKSYKKEDYLSTIKVLYQYSADKFVLGATPNLLYRQTTEQRMYPFSGQKFESYTLGIDAFYIQEIADNQLISLSGNFSTKKIIKSTNALSTDLRESIMDWLMSDYNYLASDAISLGASLRYDLKFQKLPAFYIQAGWQQFQLQKKNNNFTQLILGITF